MSNQLQSDNINELASALAKAQGSIESAVYDKVNPHFKSRYASYDAIREACQAPLATHGLSITHNLDYADGKRILVTQLTHASGQWMRSFICMPLSDKDTPQAMGSAITYCKRYALAALLAIGSDEDDDAEEAEKPYRAGPKTDTVKLEPLLTREQVTQIKAAANGDNELLYRIRTQHKKSSLEEIAQSQFETILNFIKVKTGALPHEKTGS